MPNYLTILAECFPGAEAYTGGDPTVYNDLIWVTTPIAQAVLDVSECASVDPTYDTVIVQTLPQPGETVVWDGTKWVSQVAGLEGKIQEFSFQYESSNVKNRWLSFSGGNGFPSNDVPAVIPWDCELVGMTFTNKEDGVSADIKLYAADAGSGSANTLRTTWAIRNARVGYKTDFSGMTFSAGDKIGIYIRDQGMDMDYPVITLSFRITNVASADVVEDFSTDF